MIGSVKPLIIRNLLSPYALAVVPYCGFLFAWLFPPSLYTHYLREQDLMFMNPMALLYFTACTMAFLLGVKTMSILGFNAPRNTIPEVQVKTRSTFGYLMKPLLIAAFLCSIYLYFIGAKFNIVGLLTSQQGGVIKLSNQGAGGAGANGGGDGGRWGAALFLLTAVLWWAWYRANQMHIKGATKRLFYALFVPCFLIDFLTCVATFDRTNLMPFIAGITIIYLFIKTRTPGVNLGKLAGTSIFAGCAAILEFLLLQFARGAKHLDAFITSMLGYTIVSYNRLAAYVDGSLHGAYEGKGAYVFAFLLQNGRLQGIRRAMQLPTSFALWISEFSSLHQAGLNPGYNWGSVFGYLYSDLGWWTPVYVFATGLLTGYVWSSFRHGFTLGIVFYPWIAFWILFWFGWNLLFDARGIVLLETAVILAIYDKIYLRRVREHAGDQLNPRSSWEVVGPVTGAAPPHGGMI